MKIITDHAEDELIKILSRLRDQENSQSCLHIKGASVFGNDMKGLEPFLVYWIGHHEEALTFICHDKDVFIFAPHVTPALFSKLRDRFHDYLKINNGDQKGFLAFYDTHMNGLGLLELITSKAERYRSLQRKNDNENKTESKELIRINILNQDIDQQLINTLHHRRQERNNICVMLVEDDSFSRKLVANVLKDQFELVFAENGKEALASYLTEVPNIVFLDIDLPDITGHDVLDKILSFDPKAFIVMLSGNGYIDNIKRAVASGAKGFVGKPFSKDKLMHYIKQCSDVVS
jgi:two-component system chemotaxis response regulator CheY